MPVTTLWHLHFRYFPDLLSAEPDDIYTYYAYLHKLKNLRSSAKAVASFYGCLQTELLVRRKIRMNEKNLFR